MKKLISIFLIILFVSVGTAQVKTELITYQDWPLPRIKDCPIAYYCKVHSTQELGNTPQQLVFVEALSLYVDDRAVDEKDGRMTIDALAVNPLARLGAAQYTTLGEVFSKVRPD